MPVSPSSAEAQALIRAYLDEAVSRWWGRPATPEEVARALSDEPTDDLRDPTGYLAAVIVDGTPVALGGLRYIDERTAELTKVFTVPWARGQGWGSAVLAHLEHTARLHGCEVVRLDTRSDLAEACRLYELRGYTAVAPFSSSEYSDRCYELRLHP